MRRAIAVGALAVLLGGCVEDLPTGALLDRPRVLGGRVVVRDDPTRAWPRAGEETRFEWRVAAPTAATWTSLLTVCVAAEANVGIPGCAEDPFALQLPSAPLADRAPDLAFTVPEGTEGRDLLIAGVLCANGTPPPSISTEPPECEPVEQATTTLVSTVLPVVDPERAENHHPTIRDETFVFDGERWDEPLVPLPQEGCASVTGPRLPRVPYRDDPDDPSLFAFTSDPADREEFLEDVLGQDEPEVTREELSVSHVADLGTINRLRTAIFDDEPPRPVEWAHPEDLDEVPEDGITVRFLFQIRDRRGGADWTERAICLVPADA